MARASARSRASRRPGTRTPLTFDWQAYRLPVFGVALILLTTGLINWLLSEGEFLRDIRLELIGGTGVGAFAIPAFVLFTGLWLIAGAQHIGLLAWRRLLAVALGWIAVTGIAGAVHPSDALGGVDLAAASAGGDLGALLMDWPGFLLFLAFLVWVGFLISPTLTAAGLRLGGRGLATFGQEVWASALGAAQQGEALLLGLVGLIRRQRFGLAPDPWGEEPPPDVEPGGVPPAATAPLAQANPAPAPIAPVVAAPPLRPDLDAEPAPKGSGKNRRARRSQDGWQLPAINLLDTQPSSTATGQSEIQAQIIVDTLASFGVDARVTQINEGPSVTQFGVEPGWEVRTKAVALRDADGRPVIDERGQPLMEEEEVSRTRVRVTRVTRLANDLALALAAPSIRVEAPVPGQPIIGIEVPNMETQIVAIRSILESAEFLAALRRGGLPIALGRNVTGAPVVTDLTRMPHVLIAGATGSGKSVCINSIITSLLMHFSPEQLRLVLVDPKRVELTGYEKIPHLAFSRVVTEPDEVVGVLGVVVAEMERRYRRFEAAGARNISAYNTLESTERPLPYWVVVIDELADLMLTAPIEVEQQLVRLAQLARATGIHMVVATQRPSVDVVTGLIKANFPTRIAFATTSQTDARVIMDRAGAEKLLGRGDMLFQSTEAIQARRVQGAFVADAEINEIIDFWTRGRSDDPDRPTLEALIEELIPESDTAKSLQGAAEAEAAKVRAAEVLRSAAGAAERAPAPKSSAVASPSAEHDGPAPSAPQRDSLLEEATTLAREHTRISPSLLQRRLRIGYPRAAGLIEELEADGVIAESEGGPSRLVLLHD